MANHKYFNGFTLAEVLITLGIIGVIAAITLPILIGNYQKHLVETKLKETYSILSQMMLNSVAENGESTNWDYPVYGDSNYKDSDFFDKYLAKYVKIIYSCPRVIFNNKQENYLCRNHHSSDFFNTASGGKVNWSNLAENSRKYILANGTSFYIDTIWGHQIVDPNTGPYITFIVDLNINKNKALFGRDIFIFHYMNRTEKLISSRYMDWTGHNRSCSRLEANRNAVIEECRTGALGTAGGGYDAGCTTLIMCNNWQIPNDYPVKF